MNTEKFFTPVNEAIEEIQRRRLDVGLRKRVEDFLHGDIPKHFDGDTPILYLARHVITPSFSVLRFIEITQKFNLPTVLSQDVKDKFVSNNSVKHALGKLPVMKGVSRRVDEIVEYFTVIDFKEAQGKSFSDIKTKFNTPLVDFHVNLFKEIYPQGVTIIDESDWIDRNDRGNLIEHYKKMLSLYIFHGVLFETFLAEDAEFVEKVLEPSFAFVEEHFGCRPLICELLDKETNTQRNWDAYPSIFYAHIKNLFHQNENVESI